MTQNGNDFRLTVLWSFQRALLDEVTPNLRGVAVIPKSPVIEARFIYDNVSDFEREIVSDVEAYVAADFSDPVMVSFRAVSVPATEMRSLCEGEEWVYRRKE